MAVVALPNRPGGTPVAGAPVRQAPGQDPNELIAKQFAEARKGLQAEKNQAVDELRATSGRQQALTGMGGGNAAKAYTKQLKGLEDSFLSAEKDINAQEASAKLQESQFARGQEFQEKSLAQQQEQFAQQMGLSGEQLKENARQFDEQIAFTMKEFDENQRTNFWNTMINLSKENTSSKDWNDFLYQYKNLSEGKSLGNTVMYNGAGVRVY